jgi:hypothetical protein
MLKVADGNGLHQDDVQVHKPGFMPLQAAFFRLTTDCKYLCPVVALSLQV